MNKLMEAIKEVCAFLDQGLTEELNVKIIFFGGIFLALLFLVFGAAAVRAIKKPQKSKRYHKLAIGCLFSANFAICSLLTDLFFERADIYLVAAVITVCFMFSIFFCFIYSIIILYLNKKSTEKKFDLPAKEKRRSYKRVDLIDQV